MRHFINDSFLEVMTICLFAAAAWGITTSAFAAGPGPGPSENTLKDAESVAAVLEYEIKSGDSLGAIALAHGVSIKSLVDINEIENPDKISMGQKIVIPGDPKNGFLVKGGVRLRVPKGITLSRIAELYGMSVKKIVSANKIKNADYLRAGQRLLIPGAKAVVELIPPPPCYKPPVEIFRIRSGETKKLSLCYCNGEVNLKATEALSAMSGPIGKEMPFPLHPRLVKMVQRVSEKYPGKRIEVISGQRTRKSPGHESYHNKGQALDFRVDGVSNKSLVKFVRKFDKVGAGYYPNSVFIHMDARDKKAFWIDYSAPGEKAIYGKSGMTAAAIEKIRAKRKRAKLAKKKALLTKAAPAPAPEHADKNLDEIVQATVEAAINRMNEAYREKAKEEEATEKAPAQDPSA